MLVQTYARLAQEVAQSVTFLDVAGSFVTSSGLVRVLDGRSLFSRSTL